MSRDEIYQKPQSPVPPFEFDDQVADVFEDMLQRSIPFYREIIRRQAQLIRRFYRPGTAVYDLGCSHGNLGLAVSRQMGRTPFQMIAVDNSAPMLKKYAERLGADPRAGNIDLQCRDICETPIDNASVVVLNFTLQFLPPENRTTMMQRIFDGLIPGGILLFCEKVIHADADIAALQQETYYAFKKENGYSDLEISQKREALDKVLVPESMECHLRRLKDVGFQTFDVWLKWFNFAAWLAIKPE